MSGVYGEDTDLERIDLEMRLEKIRQTSEKLSWDGFNQSQRRNLMEKKLTFDAETRMDVIQAIASMKRNIPIDTRADLPSKLRQLADSLDCSITAQQGVFTLRSTELILEIQAENSLVTSCRIGYFNRSMIPSPEIQQYLNDNNYAALRTAIQSMLFAVPSTHQSVEKQACVLALELIESDLLTDLPSGNSPLPLCSINQLPRGVMRPRTPIRPPRIFYVVDPSYVKSVRRDVTQDSDFDVLPYLELSIVQNDKDTELPAGGPGNPWSQVRPSPSCVCLKFCEPFLFSFTNWRRMEKFLVKPSIIRSHVNLFRYMSSYNFKESSLILRTRFPEGRPEHKYLMESENLKEERDVIIGEIYLKDIRNIDKILSIVRAQWKLNSVWESVLAMCHKKWKGSASIEVKLTPAIDASGIECSFSADNTVHIVSISIPVGGDWQVVTKTTNGETLDKKLDEKLTKILIISCSLPVCLAAATDYLKATPTPDEVVRPAVVKTEEELSLPHKLKNWSSEEKDEERGQGRDAETRQTKQEDMDTDMKSESVDPSPSNASNQSQFIDKVGRLWLSDVTNTKKRAVTTPDYKYDIESDEEPLGLLSSFKEIDECLKEPTPTKPDLRSHRNMSTDIASAVSELEHLREGLKFDEYSGSGFGTPTSHYGDFRPPFESPRHPSQYSGPSQPGMSSFNTPYTASPNQPYPMGQAAGFQPGQQPLSTQGGHVQLSPLESARLRLGNTISASMAVSMATASGQIAPGSGSTSAGSGSNTADVFDFAADEKSPMSAYNSPQTAYPPYGGFQTGSPLGQSQQMRGQVPKRRGGRGRRSSNMGDRLSTESQESNSSERGGRTARRPRGSRKAAQAAAVAGMTHADMVGAAADRPQFNRSFSDYAQQMQYKLSTSQPPTPQTLTSTSGVAPGTAPAPVSSGSRESTRGSTTYGSPFDEESDEECDPPPPPKPIGQNQPSSRSNQFQDSQFSQGQSLPQLTAQKPIKMEDSSAFQSPRPSASGSTDSATATPAESPASSASLQPPVLHPITTTAPSSAITQPFPSVTTTAESTASALAAAPTRTQPSRKQSLEAISNKLLRNSQVQQQPAVPKPKNFSDIYDDGTSSPPFASAEKADKMPPQLTAAVTSSSTTVAQTLSPQMSASPKDNSNDSTSSATSKTIGEKLVLKIPFPKQPSEANREKVKALKKERKANKEKIVKEVKDPIKGKERVRERKRRAGDDSLSKEREVKKHKSSDAGTSLDKMAKTPTTPVNKPLQFSNPLKNFKIPKKDTTEESKDKDKESKETKEPSTPTGSGPSSSFQSSTPSASSIPLPAGAGPPPPPRSILKKSSSSTDYNPPIASPSSSHPSLPPYAIGPGGRAVPLPPLPMGNRRGNRPISGGRGMPPHIGDHMRRPYPMGVPAQGAYMHGEAYKVPPRSQVPPPPPYANSSNPGAWVRPPAGAGSNQPYQPAKRDSPQDTPKSPSPEGMQIEDANSPEDSLRIADD